MNPYGSLNIVLVLIIGHPNTVRYVDRLDQRRKTDLCVRGESKVVGMGPLTLPLATGVEPVQKMHTYTGGRLWALRPTQVICSHLLQDSHCTMGRPSSAEWQTQRVLSLERLLRSVEGVVKPPSAVVVGDGLKELLKGSY